MFTLDYTHLLKLINDISHSINFPCKNFTKSKTPNNVIGIIFLKDENILKKILIDLHKQKHPISKLNDI